MTERINQWPDSLFYYSAASTANVREQLIKLQQSVKRLRPLSDAATVNNNGDVFQDILTGLSFGNATQRHKWKALYDTTNDRFLIQRNSGTDANKTWVELFRISSNGTVRTTGAITAVGGMTTTTGGITMGGNLDMNQFYIRNVEKINGRTRTDSLLVHGDAKVRRTFSVGSSSLFSGASAFYGLVSFDSTVQSGSNNFRPFASATFSRKATTQSISASTNTDLVLLTGLSLPNTTSVSTRKFWVQFNVTVTETSGSTNYIVIRAYNGANGNLADVQVYAVGYTLNASSLGDTISGSFQFTPGLDSLTKFGLAIQSSGTCTVQGAPPSGNSNVYIREDP